jgi:hypothetical protein
MGIVLQSIFLVEFRNGIKACNIVHIFHCTGALKGGKDKIEGNEAHQRTYECTCIVEDDNGVAVGRNLGLEGLVLLDFGLQVGGILVTLIARRLAGEIRGKSFCK